MQFNSYVYILLFLPVCILLYFSIAKRYGLRSAHLFLVAASLFFAFYWLNWLGLVSLAVSITVNYLFFRSLIHDSKSKKLILAAAVVLNVAFLIWFKYGEMFIYYWDKIFRIVRFEKQVLLPLGMSFYAFQQISFLVDAYMGDITECSFADYCLYVSFFPRIVSGPIIRQEQFLPQLKDERLSVFNWYNYSKGFFRFAIGLGKKMLLSGVLADVSDKVFEHPDRYTGYNAVIGILAYSFLIYLDFSSYCDMAIGSANMLNFELPENFNSPYKAVNIKDFWDRWHITLTQFLTKYIYIPLGGSRKGTIRTYLNILAVFLISGIWHGSYNLKAFVVWGLAHGTASALYRMFKKQIDKLPGFITWLATFVFVSLAWVPFGTRSLDTSSVLILNVFKPCSGLDEGLMEIFKVSEFDFLIGNFTNFQILSSNLWICALVFAAIIFVTVFCSKNARELTSPLKASLFNLSATVILTIWSIISLSGVGEFIYAAF